MGVYGSSLYRRTHRPSPYQRHDRNWHKNLVNLRPHQQRCRSNTVECYKSNDSSDKVVCCFDIVAGVDGRKRLRLLLARISTAEEQDGWGMGVQYILTTHGKTVSCGTGPGIINVRTRKVFKSSLFARQLLIYARNSISPVSNFDRRPYYVTRRLCLHRSVCGTLRLLSPVHTSNNVQATFDFVAKNGNIVEASTMLLVWTGL